MFIRKIHLTDFKRFKDLTIDLGDDPKRIVALVGPNGCGKSSVFDAMVRLPREYGANLGSNDSGVGFEYYSLGQERTFNFTEHIYIEFKNGRSYQELLNEYSSTGHLNTIFSFRSAYRYNSTLSVKELRAVADFSENNIGAGNASSLDQRMEDHYRRLKIAMDKYACDNDARPSETLNFFLGELNSKLKECLDLEILRIGNIDNNEGTFFFKKADTEKPFKYDVLSAGEKEVLDILLDLYLRREEYNDTIYIIDEPELHLNSAMQRKLLLEINKVVPQGCQIWIATHSIGFMRALQEELKNDSQIIEFKQDMKYGSDSCCLKQVEKNWGNWLRIFATALDDIISLVAPKTIIYCEGRDMPDSKGEEAGFDAKVYNMVFGQKYTDTLFVSSGGNTELDKRSDFAQAVLMKVLSGVNILVLKDADSNDGKPVDEVFRLEYLRKNPSNHRMLSRREIGELQTENPVCNAKVPNLEILRFLHCQFPDLQRNIPFCKPNSIYS